MSQKSIFHGSEFRPMNSGPLLGRQVPLYGLGQEDLGPVMTLPADSTQPPDQSGQMQTWSSLYPPTQQAPAGSVPSPASQAASPGVTSGQVASAAGAVAGAVAQAIAPKKPATTTPLAVNPAPPVTTYLLIGGGALALIALVAVAAG